MEAIFYGTSNGRSIVFDNRIDYESYLYESNGIDLRIEINHAAKTSQKMKMYRFLFGPVMEAAVKGFAYVGYAGIDKVAARYKLQAEFCKAELVNEKTEEIEIYLLELSKMSKARLLKFIQDCLFYIEQELGQTVPDSDTYKEMKLKEKNI